MGLDMYLSRTTYVKQWEFQTPAQQHQVTVLLGGKPRSDIIPERITHVVEEIGYWRKANQIHAWFVKNVQDGEDECRPHDVSREQLAALLALVEVVLADPPGAPALLPTQAGFFFGNTDYDDDYIADLEHTRDVLTTALALEDADFSYRSSW